MSELYGVGIITTPLGGPRNPDFGAKLLTLILFRPVASNRQPTRQNPAAQALSYPNAALFHYAELETDFCLAGA